MGDQKLPPGQEPGSPPGETGGEFNNLGSMEGSGIHESSLQVMKTAAEQGHEDLKNMQEHLPGESGEGGLDDDAPLQDHYQKQSKPLESLSNSAKKINDSSGSMITGKLGGAGQPGAGKKKTGLFLVLGLLLLGGAALIALRFVGPGVRMPNPGPPDAPVAQVPDPVQYPPNPCALQFEHPADVADIPLQGALNVEWSALPGAASYELQVIPPEGGGNPWVIPTDGTSKSIYMENFPAAGSYKFGVSALDESGEALCTAVFDFEKSAYEEGAFRIKESDKGGGGADCNPSGLFDPC